MLLSIFTPTHDGSYLADVWRCLQAQTCQSYEVVFVPNGPRAGVIGSHISELTQNDSHVRIIQAPEDVKGVGALKRFACEQCRGDALVELDHDDLIPPDCLESIATELNKAVRPTFVFSDAVTCGFDGSCVPFDSGYGWLNYQADVLGRSYLVNATPPVTARSLCDILYAPDHIRAWSRDAYERAGGHDARLAVGDDHDLVVRTYLTGTDFKHIPRPLYVHRLNPQTTSQTRLAEIAAVSQTIRDQQTHRLVGEWCRRSSLPMFDLGGAHDCPTGYVPVDIHLPEGHSGYKMDVFEFLETIPDSSVGCFRAFDFLEHVPIGRVVPLLNAIYDKLVPGGWLLTHTPAVCDDEGRCGRGAYQDPTHQSFWSTNNFFYFTRKEQAKYVPEIRCRFQAVRLGNGYPSNYHRLHLIPYCTADLVALKNDDEIYLPGPKSI